RWVVQASPTGFSAFVTPSGRVIDRTAVSERAVIRHEVELREGFTWYTNLGDRPVIALLVVGLGGTWWAARRRPTSSDPR
ncbi:MAG: apolipoprotein N-acyltransferase, partial [Actinomycetota bacterium]|nr:apolipoprotein N-acyltransferase [Actinomycetota bacterium]